MAQAAHERAALRGTHMVLTQQPHGPHSSGVLTSGAVPLTGIVAISGAIWVLLLALSSALQYSVMRYLVLSSGYLALSSDSYHIRRGRIA